MVTQDCEESEESLNCVIEGTFEVENPGTEPTTSSVLAFYLSDDERSYTKRIT